MAKPVNTLPGDAWVAGTGHVYTARAAGVCVGRVSRATGAAPSRSWQAEDLQGVRIGLPFATRRLAVVELLKPFDSIRARLRTEAGTTPGFVRVFVDATIVGGLSGPADEALTIWANKLLAVGWTAEMTAAEASVRLGQDVRITEIGGAA